MGDRKRRRRETLDRQSRGITVQLPGMSQPERAIFCPLCLRLIPESSWSVLSMEDAPPRQYGTAACERCLTCKACNNDPGGDFEKRAHDLNNERGATIERATRPNPLFTPASEALRLATVSPDERLLEIKSSYIIAYVTLGLSYMRDNRSPVGRLRGSRRALPLLGMRYLKVTGCSSRPARSIASSSLIPQITASGRAVVTASFAHVGQ